MKRLSFTILLLLFFSVMCISASAQVEQQVAFIVTDEAALIEILDDWFASKDSDYAQTATLVAAVADGSNPATHYLILNYPSFSKYEAAIDGIAKSHDFAILERQISGIATNNGDSVYVHRADNGKSEKAGDFVWTTGGNLTGDEAVFVAAYTDLLKSDLGKKAPGMVKLVANRAGGDTTHLAILTAPTLAALNEYLDMHAGNKDWETFLSKAGDMIQSSGSSFLRIVKVWK
ncbi:MAG: hypothetical protein P8Z37_19820 [Acidobacteriota bacterium]